MPVPGALDQIRFVTGSSRASSVEHNAKDERWILPDGLLRSTNLTVLQLDNVRLQVPSLDFSSCPALENLSMKECDIDEAIQIMSPSVKHLSIKCCYFIVGARPKISVPNLISMELADCHGWTPLLQTMPLLVSAFVRLQTPGECCDNRYEIGGCGECTECRDTDIGDNTSVLFEGLSNSMNLELTSAATKIIFRKDLIWCPVFSKLKTLLLNEWCITTNFGALVSFLQHSPILEKLILQFPEVHEDLVEAGEIYDTSKEPFTLKHLIVEVKCHEVYESIRRILDLLGSYDVPPEQIKIQPPPQLIMLDRNVDTWPSGSFSFEQQVETSSSDEEATSSDSSDCSD